MDRVYYILHLIQEEIEKANEEKNYQLSSLLQQASATISQQDFKLKQITYILHA